MGSKVKVNFGNLSNLVDTIKTKYYSFCPITFKLQIILDRRVKGQFQIWNSVDKTLWTQYDYNFYPITFKLHEQVMDDERRNPIDFG